MVLNLWLILVEGFESTLNFLVCLPLKFRGYRARWSMVFFCELIRGERFTVINLSSYIWKPHIFQCWEFSISCTQSWRSCNYQPMTCMHSCHHLVLRILLIVYFLIAPSLQIICKWVDLKINVILFIEYKSLPSYYGTLWMSRLTNFVPKRGLDRNCGTCARESCARSAVKNGR